MTLGPPYSTCAFQNYLGKPIESKNYQTLNLQGIAYNIVNFDDFCTPRAPPRAPPLYTLPLINTMPPSSANVIEDDDTFSSTISDLNADRFTHSGGDDASSDSTLYTLPQSRLVKGAS